MKKEIAEALIEIMEEFCEENAAKIYEEYSGRGMYGDKTTGIVVSSVGDLIAAIISRADLLVEDEYEFTDAKFDVKSIRIDSLGRDTIIY